VHPRSDDPVDFTARTFATADEARQTMLAAGLRGTSGGDVFRTVFDNESDYRVADAIKPGHVKMIRCARLPEFDDGARYQSASDALSAAAFEGKAVYEDSGRKLLAYSPSRYGWELKVDADAPRGKTCCKTRDCGQHVTLRATKV
jgi:hypothetical protein